MGLSLDENHGSNKSWFPPHVHETAGTSENPGSTVQRDADELAKIQQHPLTNNGPAQTSARKSSKRCAPTKQPKPSHGPASASKRVASPGRGKVGELIMELIAGQKLLVNLSEYMNFRLFEISSTN